MSWKLKKKCLDLLAREDGCVRKIWGEAATICLAYPNAYRTGMSNLGFQAVYALINRHPGSLCERVFLPDSSDEAAHVASPARLFSLESQRPLADFDMVAFSLSFENDYPNVLKILDMAGIPLSAAERAERDPLVIGGGIAVTLNPEPLADFFDLFLIGEGEALLPDFLDAAAVALRCKLKRKDFLDRIQQSIHGAYVPCLYRVTTEPEGRIAAREPLDSAYPRRIIRRTAPDINAFPTEQEITTEGSEFGGMFLTEVSRGCRRGCRFCAAGFVCRPARFRSAATLEASFRRGLEKRKTIGLLGTAVSDHPELIPLCRSILKRGGAVAVGSFRLDRLNGPMAALLKDTGIETLSLAPEAGSQRLRNVIRKGITEAEIFSAVDNLLEYDIVRLRLYFMVGLPTETDEDVDAIVRLVKAMEHRARHSSAGKKGFRSLTLSINQFIPKPATPFQWCPLEDTAVVKRRIRRIKDGLRGEKAVSVTHDLPKWNYIQALLTLGDRRVGKLLLAVHRFEGNWAQAFREVNVNPDFYVYRRKETDEILPWDFIDHGVEKTLLVSEYRKSFSGEILEETRP
jgi:radical SAM superfamily enzyme YgiQ (UPF0313 family)